MAHKEVTIDSVRSTSIKGEWVIILKQGDTEEYLPIFVGASQANIVKRELIGSLPTDTRTYDNFLAGIDIASSNIESVIIDGPEKGGFCGKLLLSQGINSLLVECPVVSAIALGIRKRARILVSEQSFLEAGIILRN